jgi:hypothetical protein
VEIPCDVCSLYCRIEVWGVDPWVNQGKPLKVQDSIFATQYYAQHLVPYTRYKLKVFAVNGESVYNPALPLEIVERTLATIPAPPEYVKVTLKEARKVHLNWRPKYPANGLIRQYVIRVGVVTENAETKAPLIIWRRRYTSWTTLEEDHIAFLLPTPKCTNCIKQVLMLKFSKTDI